MTQDDISDFGKDVSKKNKQYWIRYFNNIEIHSRHNLDPIKQIKEIKSPGKYKIFYMVREKKNENEIIISLNKKDIELEEL